MVSLQSFERIDFTLAAALAGVALLMLVWNLVNVVRLSRLGRKMDLLESDLEKKVLEMEKLRKERQETASARTQQPEASSTQNQGIEIVSSGVVAAPGVAEAVAQEIPAVFSSADAPSQPPIDVSPMPDHSVESQIEIVQSGHYSEPEAVQQPLMEAPIAQVPEQAPNPPVPANDFGVVMEPVEFDIDLGSRGVKEAQLSAEVKPPEPQVEFTPAPLPLEPFVPAEETAMVAAVEPRKESEPSLEEKMIDQFEKTSSHEVSIRMYNPQKRIADFKTVRDALKKAIDEMATTVKIDLSDVFFIYPQEIAELGRQIVELKKNGAQVQFAGVSPELEDLLRGQGLETNPS